MHRVSITIKGLGAEGGGGLDSLVPFSHFTEQIQNSGVSRIIVFHTWTIELTRAAQLGTIWTLN